MPVENIERTIPRREGRDLFQEVQQVLQPYVERFSLAQEVDQQQQRIRVHRLGFDGKLQVSGDTIRLSLDYSRLIPGSLRQRITDGVVSSLDRLAAPDGPAGGGSAGSEGR